MIRGTAMYTYLCPIWYSYSEAWKKVENRAVEYSRDWYEENAEIFIRKEDEPHFTELFEKYYGKEEAEKLYIKINEEKNEKLDSENNIFTEAQKEQVNAVIKFVRGNIVTTEEKEIFKDWLKGINPYELNDKELQNEIGSL